MRVLYKGSEKAVHVADHSLKSPAMRAMIKTGDVVVLPRSAAEQAIQAQKDQAAEVAAAKAYANSGIPAPKPAKPVKVSKAKES